MQTCLLSSRYPRYVFMSTVEELVGEEEGSLYQGALLKRNLPTLAKNVHRFARLTPSSAQLRVSSTTLKLKRKHRGLNALRKMRGRRTDSGLIRHAGEVSSTSTHLFNQSPQTVTSGLPTVQHFIFPRQNLASGGKGHMCA